MRASDITFSFTDFPLLLLYFGLSLSVFHLLFWLTNFIFLLIYLSGCFMVCIYVFMIYIYLITYTFKFYYTISHIVKGEKHECFSHSVVSDSCNPWTADHQNPLSMKSSKQEYWSGLPFSSSGDLPNSEIQPGYPALQEDSLPSEPPRKPLKYSRGLT